MSDEGPSGFYIQRALQVWNERRQQIIAEDDEVSDEDARRAAAAADEGIDAMLTWLVRSAKSASATAEAIKRDRHDLAVREKRFEAREESLRNAVQAIIEATERPDNQGRRKKVLPIATITVSGGGGKQVEITDETNIPDEYYTDVTWVKKRSGLQKDNLLLALTGEEVDQKTGEILPAIKIDGVTVSTAPAKLTIRGK